MFKKLLGSCSRIHSDVYGKCVYHFCQYIKKRVVYQLKEASVNDASATPPTIGKREETIQKLGICMHREVKLSQMSLTA